MGNKRLFSRRKVMAGAAAATAGLTIWSQRLSAQSGEVALGAMVPITGPFNVSGQQYHFSLQMAQDEINAKGGVAGKKLKIVFEDVKDSNSVAVNAYLKVVRDINPPMVFLSSYTTQNLATEPEVTKAQIPGMYAGGGDAMHLKKNPWLFRIRPADGLQALALAKHATEGLGKKKIGIIYVQNDFGQPGAVAAEKIVKAAGAEVVGMEAYAFTDNDMSAQLQKLKNAGADCLICISYGKDGALILKLLKEMNIDLPVVTSSGVMVPAARNLIAPDELDEGQRRDGRLPCARARTRRRVLHQELQGPLQNRPRSLRLLLLRRRLDHEAGDGQGRHRSHQDPRRAETDKGLQGHHQRFRDRRAGQYGPFARGFLDQARHPRPGVHPHHQRFMSVVTGPLTTRSRSYAAAHAGQGMVADKARRHPERSEGCHAVVSGDEVVRFAQDDMNSPLALAG